MAKRAKTDISSVEGTRGGQGWRQGRRVQGPQAGAGEPETASGNQDSDWSRQQTLISHWLKELEEARAGGKDVAEEAEEKTKKIHASIIKLEEQVLCLFL